MTELTYRGWAVNKNFIGQFEAVHPDYDASWEGEEDGYVSNGLHTTSSTLDGLKAEVDVIIEERSL